MNLGGSLDALYQFLTKGGHREGSGLPFHPPHSSLRTSYPRPQREVSVSRRVHRVAPRNRLTNPDWLTIDGLEGGIERVGGVSKNLSIICASDAERNDTLSKQ